MKDILCFKDDLITFLYKEDETNPSSLVDITDFVKSYFPHLLQITTVINDLFSHSKGDYGLITSDMDLGPYGFNQQYFNRHIVPPLKARITPSGKKYFHEFVPNENGKHDSPSFQDKTISPGDKVDWDKAFFALWKVIGPQDTATHYMSGPQFYKLIIELCDDIPPSYTNYIEYRRKKELSTSRVDYYNDLINHLSEDKRKEFYRNIQSLLNGNTISQKRVEKTENNSTISITEIFEPSIKSGHNQDANPTVFISYSWDNQEHEHWVLTLATKLTENGVNVILDKWDLEPLGKPLPNFMENSIAKSERVICVMTPNYKRKTEQLTGGVGYEYSIITSEILSNGVNTSKFIPLFRNGLETDAIPTALKGRKYVDMKDDSLFEEKLVNELLRDIHQQPKYKKPPIGKKPVFD